MDKIDKKYIIIPAGIFIILVVVVLLVPSGKKKTNNIAPTPTLYALPTRIPNPGSSVQITPTIIPPQSFTGASENQQLPPEVQNLGIQKTELRHKTPLTEPFGVITFDYKTDKFIVSLAIPKESNSLLFQNWLTQNYPSIPLDRFIEK